MLEIETDFMEINNLVISETTGISEMTGISETSDASETSETNDASLKKQEEDERMRKVRQKQRKTDECIELKNIKYKTMLLNGVPMKETKQSRDINNLEKFLEDEKNNNKSEPWCKLDKTIKTTKMIQFAEKYAVDKSLSETEQKDLSAFLLSCLDKKKLQRVKDVIYDKTLGEIKDIPSLSFTKTTKHFTLKNTDNKRVSTLKSLGPKKSQTIKNKVDEDE